MPLNDMGNGTVEFRVTSTTFVPSHNEAPIWTPENPDPAPVVVPDMVTAVLTPLEDPDSTVTIKGSVSITSTVLDAFAVGSKYTMTLAAE